VDEKKQEYKFRLHEILKERGISVSQLAADAGIHYQTAMNVYHNRTRGISLDAMAGICRVLHIKPGDLIDTGEIVEHIRK
jgi:DNA-binding Xre family transcriptional regulator